MPTLSLAFPSKVWVHVTNRRRNSHYSCSISTEEDRFQLVYACLLDLDSSPVPLSVLWGGQMGAHDTSGPYWGLQPAPGLFWGSDWRRLLQSTVEQSVWSSWRVWREGINAKNNRWQLDTLRLHGNVRAGWDRKDRRAVKYPTTPCPKLLNRHVNRHTHSSIISCKRGWWKLL